jgi:hypothetical protein
MPMIQILFYWLDKSNLTQSFLSMNKQYLGKSVFKDQFEQTNNIQSHQETQRLPLFAWQVPTRLNPKNPRVPIL